MIPSKKTRYCDIGFKTVSLGDKDWISKILKMEDSRSADCNFANMFAWDDTFHKEVSQFGDRILIRLLYQEKPLYLYPFGAGDIEPAILRLQEDAEGYSIPLKLRGVTKENLELLKNVFPGQFDVIADTSVFDYVYSLEKMATLAGKKLHGKRNHINRFLENNDWSFELIDSGNISECIELSHSWADDTNENNDIRAENLALRRVFDNYQELELEGGILRSAKEIIGFTIGERLNSDTFIVHFEKAVSSIQGAYPMINREFSRYIRDRYPDIQYLNREEDMGKENLRRAKRSYYPEMMVEKYTAVWKH